MASPVYFIPASREDDTSVLAAKTKRIFQAIALEKEIDPDSLVAVKIHFGEKGNTGYIKPAWLSGLTDVLKKRSSRVFFTDTNTLYVGNRSNSVDHLALAADHGFHYRSLGVPVIIADGLIGRDDDEIEVGLPRVKTAKIASTFINSDVLLCLNHFTGHIMSGVGAAIKNLGMGCASRAGKLEQHSDVHPFVNSKACRDCGTCLEFCPTGALKPKKDSVFIQDEECIGCGECLVVCPSGAIKLRWDGDAIRCQEKMAEYAYSVWKLFGPRSGFINFLLQITKDCDCMSKDGQVIAEDIGILASRDPVALDKASADIVLSRSKKDVLREANSIDWMPQLSHAVNIGLGQMEYELVEIS